MNQFHQRNGLLAQVHSTRQKSYSVAQTFLSVRFEAVFKDYTGRRARRSACATEASSQAISEILSCSKVQVLFAQVLFVLTITVWGYSQAFAQTPAQVQCDVVKQVLFLVDVSGSMETNDRLNEAKQFMLRTAKENSAKNYLYKLISFGGSCNEIQTDVDWTRDGTIFSAGVKGLYLRGGTPLGSAIEFTMDEIKKSAYPDQTKVVLLNDGANACGEVSEILTRRLKEIPCVRFVSIGIELDDDENGLASRAIADAKALATQTGGSYVPLKDVREIRGVSLNDTAVVVRSVEFEPRKKPEVAQQPAPQTSQNQATQTQSAQTQSQPSQTQSSSQPTQSQTAQSSTQSSQTASQTPANTASPNRPDSSVQAEKQPQSAPSQSAPSQSTTSQSTSSQGAAPKESASTPASSSEKKSRAEPVKQENPQPSSQSSQADSRPANDSAKSASPPAGQSQTQQADKPEPSAPNARAQQRGTASSNPPQQGYNAFRTQGSESRVQGNESRVEGSKGNAETVVLRFILGSTRLMEDSRVALARLEMELRVRPVQRIEVDGHSSGEGSSAANLRLSVERASAIANILRRQTGMSEERVRWTGYGELRPVAGVVRFGSAASRRVEIRLYR